MRDARNATYRHSRTAPRINNAGVPVAAEDEGEREKERERERENPTREIREER